MRSQLLLTTAVGLISGFVGALCTRSPLIEPLIDRGARPLRVSRLEIVDPKGVTRAYIATDERDGALLALLDERKQVRISLNTVPYPEIRVTGLDGSERVSIRSVFDRPVVMLSDKGGPRITIGSPADGCVRPDFEGDPWHIRFHAASPHTEYAYGLGMARESATGRDVVRSYGVFRSAKPPDWILWPADHTAVRPHSPAVK
jgi:hypothetical protein